MRNVNDFENGFKVSGMDYVEFQEKVFHFKTLILRAYSRIGDSIHQGDLKGLDGRLSAIKDLERDRFEFLKQFNFVESIMKESEKLKEGDVVKVIKEFWFYADFYEVGSVFTITEEMVNHNFEKFTKKINEGE